MIIDNEGGRAVQAIVRVEADPDRVWQALSSPEEIQRWFPLVARGSVEPGGQLEVSWDEENWWGMHVEVPEHGRHLRLVTKESDHAGGEMVLYVDIHVEGEAGATTVRLVHSGFGAEDKWDEYLDGLDAGWGYFVRNLAVYLERHFGSPRTMLWERVKVAGPRAAVWEAAVRSLGVDPGDAQAGEGADCVISMDGEDDTRGVVQVAVPGRTFAALLPDRDDAIVFAEVESEGENGQVGLWISTYDAPDAVMGVLRDALAGAAERLGAASPVG